MRHTKMMMGLENVIFAWKRVLECFMHVVTGWGLEDIQGRGICKYRVYDGY